MIFLIQPDTFCRGYNVRACVLETGAVDIIFPPPSTFYPSLSLCVSSVPFHSLYPILFCVLTSACNSMHVYISQYGKSAG